MNTSGWFILLSCNIIKSYQFCLMSYMLYQCYSNQTHTMGSIIWLSSIFILLSNIDPISHMKCLNCSKNRIFMVLKQLISTAILLLSKYFCFHSSYKTLIQVANKMKKILFFHAFSLLIKFANRWNWLLNIHQLSCHEVNHMFLIPWWLCSTNYELKSNFS